LCKRAMPAMPSWWWVHPCRTGFERGGGQTEMFWPSRFGCGRGAYVLTTLTPKCLETKKKGKLGHENRP
jgi:hypothetical protein